MKRKVFSILFALVLVLSLSLVTAAPASAYGVTDYTNAVLDAADRLAANQNADGGFMWDLTDPAGDSTTNTLGITAMGILKAYELEDKATYETALAKAYMYAVDNPPTYTDEEETIKGVDSFPDVTFMVWLAHHASHDTTLLGAIQTQVPGTTAASIAALAKTRWDDKVTNLGGGSATVMAEKIRNDRAAAGYYDCIPWDLEAAVKAALALNAYYPGEGYDTQAISIATVIYNAVDDPAGDYFNSGDTSQEGYVLGLTGAIEAFQEVGLYGEKVAALKVLLLDVQDPLGYWNWHGPSPADMSVQNTAYAVMALLSQGESDAVAAAQNGVDWLLDAQTVDGGGWYAEDGAAPENLEVDSEAAWAIKWLLDRFSGEVGMYARYTPWIGISVDPTWVDFGDVVPGDASDPRSVSIHNYGNVDVLLTASIINESPPGVYTSTPGLTIEGTSVAAGWSFQPLVHCVPLDVELILTVPSGTEAGSYTATLVFWAEQAP